MPLFRLRFVTVETEKDWHVEHHEHKPLVRPVADRADVIRLLTSSGPTPAPHAQGILRHA